MQDTVSAGPVLCAGYSGLTCNVRTRQAFNVKCLLRQNEKMSKVGIERNPD